MDLKDYISKVITQLGEGINDANNNLKGGAYVVSDNLSDSNNSIIQTKDEDDKNRIVTIIDFEIPIETDGAYIKVAELNSFKAQGPATYVATLSKIKFQLPLALPKVGNKE